MWNSLRHQWPAIIWAAFIVVVCSLPASDLPQTGRFFEGFDKLAHTVFFFVLSALLFYGKIRQQKSYSYRLLTLIKIVAIGFSLGVAIELMQWKWFTYRSAECWDLFCDMLGLGMGVFFYVCLHQSRSNENSH